MRSTFEPTWPGLPRRRKSKCILQMHASAELPSKACFSKVQPTLEVKTSNACLHGAVSVTGAEWYFKRALIVPLQTANDTCPNRARVSHSRS